MHCWRRYFNYRRERPPLCAPGQRDDAYGGGDGAAGVCAARGSDGARTRTGRASIDTAVRVVALRTAYVGDRQAASDGTASFVPGVATRLREQFAVNREKPFADGVVPREYKAPLPIIEADIDRNAIVIRDRPERLDADAQMVRDLDGKPSLNTTSR